ncbi:hypothetical protein [Candidatus Glomeribacter gigasporarum]|uniref:hypothetical protein n=1 Tax=Candidatus Glomeribacter gigasporarum TaxID=132144 RepID=UPI0019398E99|nr:hypothetical protein [Candidatus Glomeribacter gigasporarum]
MPLPFPMKDILILYYSHHGARELEHFSVIFPVSLLCSEYSGSLRGRLHCFAMETCSARIDPHTVFALAPWANRLKNALAQVSAQARIRTVPPVQPQPR